MRHISRAALFLVLFPIFAGFQIIPGSTVATGEYIGDSRAVDVSGDVLIVTRCYDFLRVNMSSGAFYDITLDTPYELKILSAGDSVFVFSFIDRDIVAGTVNIKAMRIYPSMGIPRLMQISYPVEEWFPIFDGVGLKLLVTVNTDEGDSDSAFFREGRDYIYLTYPELVLVHSLAGMPKPVELYETDEELSIIGERNVIAMDSLPEYFLEMNITEYSAIHISKETLDTVATVHLGNKGYREEHPYSGGMSSLYEGITVGVSDKDTDGDGHIDFPTVNSTFGDSSSYSVKIDGRAIFLSDTALSYDFIFLSDFLPGEGGDLLLGSEYLAGADYSERGELSLPIMTEIKYFHDIDGDGFSELFGWWADTVKSYVIEPDIVAWEFARGWNVISLPFSSMDSIAEAYPFIIPPLFAFDPEAGTYNPTDTMGTGIGYFALSDMDTVLYPTGDTITAFEYEYQRGWNIVGTTSRWLSAIELGDMEPIYLGPFSYDPATRNYTDKEAIMPGTGFLFLATDSGEIVIEAD